MEQPMVRLEPETMVTDNPGGDEDAMATAEERMAILRMIEQGKISAEEGARLLAALGGRGQGTPPPRPGTPPRSEVFDTSRGLRIRVYDLFNNQAKVNVSVPVGLFRLVRRFIPASANVDLDQIEQAIESGAIGRIVEVVDNEGGTRVEIGIE